MVKSNSTIRKTSTYGYNGGKTQWFLIGSILITALVYIIPFGRTFAYPLILLSTLVHEMGHGLAAMLVGANFKAFHMWADGSGVAYIHGNTSRLGQAFISAGGLVGPAIMAAILFLVAKKDSLARITLTALGALLIVAEFLFVRNMFGWVFVGIIAAICLWLAQQPRGYIAQTSLVFVGLQLALSVFSRMDYLFTKNAITAQGVVPSDVSQMAEALFLPYWFWGGVCTIFSLVVLYVGIRSYLKK